VSNHCDCHPWSSDDERIWCIVKKEFRTKEQWKHLHNALEEYRRKLIEDYKVSLPRAPEEPQP
jgi:hypothetical protein